MTLELLTGLQLNDYFKVYRAIITIRDVSNDPTYLFYDSFNPPDPHTQSPFISYCEVDLAYGQAGTFMLRIHDPDNKLDTNKIGLGNRVWIQAGREEDKLYNLFSGVCRQFKVNRPGYNILTHEMSGFGTQIIFNERIVNFLRQALRRTDNPNKPFVDDPNMKAYLLFKELCERTDVIPTGKPAIKHTLYPGMFNTSELIDPAVDTFIASLTEPYVSAAQVANSIADSVGAIWGVEPGSPNTADRVFLRFPSTLHSGILIKDKPSDDARNTEPFLKNVSYLKAQTGFSFTDSMKQEDGFVNKPFSKTSADNVSGSAAASNENYTPVHSIDIAQQIVVNATQFRDIAVTVSIDGVGEQSPLGTISGWNPSTSEFAIVNDDNGRPGSVKELDLSFPLHLENGQPRTIFLQLPQEHRLKTLKPGDKAWLIMYLEGLASWSSEIPSTWPDGCHAGHDSHTMRWHHDNGTTGVSAIRTVCRRRPSLYGERYREPALSDTTSGWVINNAGPTYSYTFYDSFSHVVESSDADSIQKYGELDTFIDASFITDEETMSQFLASYGQYAAKPRRIYEMAEVYIPYLSPLQPGQLVTVVDTKSGLAPEKNTVAEIQEVRYEFSAESPGRTPLGTNVCEVRLVGYVDFKEQYVLAPQEAVLELPQEPPGTGEPPPSQPPPMTGSQIDTDKVMILNKIDTTQGKFHRNIVDLNLGTGSWGSSSVLQVDAEGNGVHQTLGSLHYWAFEAREGSFASSGNKNYTVRLDWKSSTGSTTCGVSKAKTNGTIGRTTDTKNCEVTAIVRIRNVPNQEQSHHHISIKPRGNGHSDSNNECTLQVGGRLPFTTKGRQNDLYSVEYTHPSYDYSDVTFVSPYNSSNYPQVPVNSWFGLKFILYNVNNNQSVHAEMWVDTNPINAAQNGFNNNWKKVWVYEHSGSKAPTWAGPACQLRTNLAQDVDIIAYNIHEIIPPTTTSSTANAIELAERAEYEETTGLQHPEYIAQMLTAEEIGEDADPPEIIQDSVNAASESIPLTDITVTGDMIPVKENIVQQLKVEVEDEADD